MVPKRKILLKAFVISISAFFIAHAIMIILAAFAGTKCAEVGTDCYYRSASVLAALAAISFSVAYLWFRDRRLLRVVLPMRVSIFWVLVSLGISAIIAIPFLVSTTSMSIFHPLYAVSLLPNVAFEELAFRGLLYSSFSNKNKVLNALVVSFAFTLIHFDVDLIRTVVLFIAGLLLWWLRDRSRSISAPLIVHTTHNLLFFTFG